MKAVVIYESMYGNTHLIASAIADGLGAHGEATVVPVAEARASVVEGADLVVVGGPTHAHGMSRAATRKGAVDAARKPGSDLVLDAPEGSDAAGLRDWFASIGQLPKYAAAFDTRFDLPAAFTDARRKALPASCAIRVQSCCRSPRASSSRRTLTSNRKRRLGPCVVGRAAGKRGLGPRRAGFGVELRALAARA